MVALAPDLSGSALDDRYELHALIGEGAFGRVYRGLDRRLARPVAVKLIKPWWAQEDAWVERFEREAQMLARVSDPGIVQIYDIGHADSGPYYVAELVDGESLAARLRRGSLTAAQARVIGVRLCDALAGAHAQGIVHCDVKPANVLITAAGRVKVGDFGVARLAEGTSQAASSTVAGTPRYMSPEQARGRPTGPATDVYSAGIVIYEMLTGKPPFAHGSPVELGLRHVQEQPPPLPATVPAALRAVVARALAKDPAERYRDGAAMAAALRSIGPHAGGPHAGGPHAGGPHAGGPHAGGPHAGGPHGGDPHTGDPHTGGPHAGDPHAGDPHVAGSHTGGRHAAGPHAAPSHTASGAEGLEVADGGEIDGRAAGKTGGAIDGRGEGVCARAEPEGQSRRPGAAPAPVAEEPTIDRSSAPTVLAGSAATRILGRGRAGALVSRQGSSLPSGGPPSSGDDGAARASRRRSLGGRSHDRWPYVVPAVLLALGIGVLAAALLAAAGAPRVRVPGVVGRPASAAEHELTQVGLRYATTTIAAPGSQPGSVTHQSPTSATSAHRGAVVALSVAETPRWRALTSFGGVNDGRSVPFSILGAKWRVVYHMAYVGTCTLLVVCFGPSAEVTNLKTGVSFGQFELGEGQTETRTFASGPGLYRLDVSGGHDSARWSMTVEDYY